MPRARGWRGSVLVLLASLLGGIVAWGQGPPLVGLGSQLRPDSANHAAMAQVTATAIADIEPSEHNILHRPIELSDDYAHWADRSYAYGSTQWGRRAVHLGVEFVNPRDTPVYAAKAGVVVFAGDDAKTLLGPRQDYYGNVVVLAHEEYSLAGLQVFTLYGHLEEVEVAAGQALEDLDRLGRIGSTGVAIGPHLHFEVRVDDPYDFRMTRNPELWLQHYVDRGMIIGALRDADGELVYGKRISARSDTLSREVASYGGDIVNPDPVWQENFTIGDLPAGDYELVVLSDSGSVAYAETVAVEAYRTTYVEIVVAET